MFKNLIWLGALIVVAGVFIYAMSSNKIPPPKSAAAAIKPIATLTPTSTPETKTNSIIPIVTPILIQPRAKNHDYIFNTTEYFIAVRASAPQMFSEIKSTLKENGYDLSNEEILEFQKKHGLELGDTLTIQGKVTGVKMLTTNGSGVKLESIGFFVCESKDKPEPLWVSSAVKKQSFMTFRGTVAHATSMTDCRPVPNGQ